MNAEPHHDRHLVARYLMVMAACVILVAGLQAAKAVVVPFLLSVFLAAILTPPLRWLERKGLPTAAALLVIFAIVATLIGSVVVIVGQSINQFSRNMPQYVITLRDREKEVLQWLRDFGIELDNGDSDRQKNGGAADSRNAAETNPLGTDEHPGDAPEDSAETPRVDQEVRAEAKDVAEDTREILAEEIQDAFVLFDPKYLTQALRLALAETGGLLSNALIIFITVVFMLLEAARLPGKLRAAMAESSRTPENFSAILENIRRYMVIKSCTSLLTGVLVAVMLMVLGVDYAMMWGLLAFLFNFVPNIGSILAAVPAVALALVTRDLNIALWTVVGYLAVNFTVSYAIEPRFMGQGLGLSTLVVFLSLVFWGWVLGPVGMFLSAPLTMVVKIILADFEETRWVAILLGGKVPEGSGRA